MKIYISSDHNGFAYKNQLITYLTHSGHEVIDCGGTSLDPADDFPLQTAQAMSALLADDTKDARGMLICGSGQGVCMAANRFKGIRASLCWNLEEARLARNDDDSNVLCLSASQTSFEDTKAIVTTWLATPFAGAERFVRRNKQLDQIT